MDPTTQAVVPAMANMQLVAAQAQNNALQANNEANTQMLQLMEKMQTAFQSITEENARLSARITAMEETMKIKEDLHQSEITALKDQNRALQNHVDDIAKKEVDHLSKTVTIEERLKSLREDYDKHYHNTIIRCGGGIYNIVNSSQSSSTPLKN